MKISAELRRFSESWLWIVTGLLGMVWAGQIFLGFVAYSSEEYQADEDVVLRYVDRELLLLESGREDDGVVRWVTGNDRREEALLDLRTVLEEVKDWDSWEGEPAVAAIDGLLEEEVELEGVVSELGREEFKDYLLSEHAPSYLCHLFLAEWEDEEIEELLRGKASVQLKRSLWMPLIEWGVMILGLGLLVSCVRAKRDEIGRKWRYPARWAPALVLGGFFFAGIVGDWFYSAFGIVMYFASADLYWPWIAADFFWRMFPALFLTVVFFLSPGGMIRVFGLDQGVQWRFVFGGLGVLSAFYVVWEMLSPGGVVDPSDFLVVADPDGVDVFEDVLSGVIAAPVFEEILFRGFLLMGLRYRLGWGWAGVISTLLFAVVHIQYDVLGVVSVGFFGGVCAWVTWKTRSISSGMAMHLIFNLLITIDVYVSYQMKI